MLSIVVGNLGSGKTLFLVFMAKLLQNKKIYSNFELKLSNYNEFVLNDFLENKYENCVIFLDEMYVYLESRCSGNTLNRVMSYLLFQSRKSNIQIYGTVQLLKTIDNRFRSLVDYTILAEICQSGFKYTMFDRKTLKLKTFIVNYENAKSYFELYNTKQKIEFDTSKVQKLTMSSNQRMDTTEEYANQIIAEYPNRKITKDIVHYFFEKNSYPQFLEKLTYTTIKTKLLDKKSEEKSQTTV